MIADLGVKNMTSEVLAIRGERLVLSRVGFTGRDRRPDAFHTELLRSGEMGADERMIATITFDLDDFDAAIAELDARYLAGEAAAHAHTWSVIARAYAAAQSAANLPRRHRTVVSIDHRASQWSSRATDRHTSAPRWTSPPTHVRIGGCASAEPTSARSYPCGPRNLARGLRRRVAGDRRRDCRRRHDQPQRNLRRGRPRRRAREIRTAQPSRRGWKTRQAKSGSASGATSRPATGTPWQEPGRRHSQRRSSTRW